MSDARRATLPARALQVCLAIAGSVAVCIRYFAIGMTQQQGGQPPKSVG